MGSFHFVEKVWSLRGSKSKPVGRQGLCSGVKQDEGKTQCIHRSSSQSDREKPVFPTLATEPSLTIPGVEAICLPWAVSRAAVRWDCHPHPAGPQGSRNSLPLAPSIRATCDEGRQCWLSPASLSLFITSAVLIRPGPLSSFICPLQYESHRSFPRSFWSLRSILALPLT